MNDRWRLRLRYTLTGAVYAFLFPLVFILAMSKGSVGVLPALFAACFNAVTAGPMMTFLFIVMVPFTRRFPFVPAMLIQTVSFLGAGAVLMVLNIALVTAVFNHSSLTDPRVYSETVAIVTSREMKIAFLVGSGIFLAMSMYGQLQRKLGPGVLWSWLTGKYHRPREEQLVFMFLDLKDSTPLAERLGSLRFSNLLQEFFDDLGLAVWACKGTVSHYIGDEAVIVWRPESAFKSANCLHIYDKMQVEVAKRSEMYKAKFGVVPTFKAGVHVGPVVAAEVGRAKSEIVYHGDAVNTTARIVGMCSPLDRDLIVSKEVADRIQGSNYAFEPLGTHALKGKSEPLELFAVRSK